MNEDGSNPIVFNPFFVFFIFSHRYLNKVFIIIESERDVKGLGKTRLGQNIIARQK